MAQVKLIINILRYPTTFVFEVVGPLPKFEYGCKVRKDRLVRAMRKQKIKSLGRYYTDYVVEAVEENKHGEIWTLGS